MDYDIRELDSTYPGSFEGQVKWIIHHGMSIEEALERFGFSNKTFSVFVHNHDGSLYSFTFYAASDRNLIAEAIGDKVVSKMRDAFHSF